MKCKLNIKFIVLYFFLLNSIKVIVTRSYFRVNLIGVPYFWLKNAYLQKKDQNFTQLHFAKTKNYADPRKSLLLTIYYPIMSRL